MRKLFILIGTLFSTIAISQELKCTILVNSQKVGGTNQKVFKTLETTLNDFVNNTAWTTNVYKQNEKISCSMTINVDAVDGDSFTASLQVQSSRTAFNSTYSTPILNINDKDFNFKYQEFENLNYNPNNFDSNLISVIAFYANLIIGLDQDSLSKFGGSKAIESAQNIAGLAQSSGNKGWSLSDGMNTRYYLINDLQSPSFSPLRESIYDYNFNGIDIMEKNPRVAKDRIIDAIDGLKKIYDNKPNAYIMKVFFDTKVDEIVAVFSGGPKNSIISLLDNLAKLSPAYDEKWNSIKN